MEKNGVLTFFDHLEEKKDSKKLIILLPPYSFPFFFAKSTLGI